MWKRISGLYPIDAPLLEGDPKGGMTAAEIEAHVQRLLDRKGDKGAIEELLRDNFKQREEIRTLKEKADAAPKVPEGGLILKADEAKAWQAYQALGKPDDLKKSLEQKGELELKVKEAERAAKTQVAAEAAGYKPSVLGKLPGADKLSFDVKEETVDGQKVQVAYVTEEKQGSVPRKLTDYAEEVWKDFIPSLQADAEDGRPATSRGNPTGTPFVKQHPSGAAPKNQKLSVEEVADSKRGSRDYLL